jgi:hypothetical protein
MKIKLKHFILKIKKFAFVTIFLLFILGSKTIYCNEIVHSKLNLDEIPKKNHFEGSFIDGYKWFDITGEHIVILSESGPKTSFHHEEIPKKNDVSYDCREAHIYAYHYIKKNSKLELMTKIYDFIRECPFDLDATFIKNSFEITDLNNDNIYEYSFLYKLYCRSDVSPSSLKFILYDGKNKYAIRGNTKIKVSIDPVEYYGGNIEVGSEFMSAPHKFKEFAVEQWGRFVEEDF